jgi:ribonuclease P protein component
MRTLKTRREFQRVQKGRKAVTPAFILQGLAAEQATDDREPRFGFTVSSKAVAKDKAGVKKRGTAVDRNRARRRLKEAVRLSLDAARNGFDYVVIGREPALSRKFDAILADMRQALHVVHGEAKRLRSPADLPAARDSVSSGRENG